MQASSIHASSVLSSCLPCHPMFRMHFRCHSGLTTLARPLSHPPLPFPFLFCPFSHPLPGTGRRSPNSTGQDAPLLCCHHCAGGGRHVFVHCPSRWTLRPCHQRSQRCSTRQKSIQQKIEGVFRYLPNAWWHQARGRKPSWCVAACQCLW